MQIAKRTDATEEMMIVALSGDFDLSAVASVRSVFHEVTSDGWSIVLVDLEAVDFVDSAALGVLIGLQRRCRAIDGECVLAAAQPEVTRLLEVTGLDTIFLTSASVEAGAALALQRQAASAT